MRLEIQNLLDSIKKNKLQISGLSLLKPDFALKILEKAKDSNIKLLGIDAFRVFEGKKVQPVQDFTTDVNFYKNLSTEEFYEFNIKLIKEGTLQDLWFEVWLDREN